MRMTEDRCIECGSLLALRDDPTKPCYSCRAYHQTPPSITRCIEERQREQADWQKRLNAEQARS